jgi:hypothetical protein
LPDCQPFFNLKPLKPSRLASDSPLLSKPFLLLCFSRLWHRFGRCSAHLFHSFAITIHLQIAELLLSQFNFFEKTKNYFFLPFQIVRPNRNKTLISFFFFISRSFWFQFDCQIVGKSA